MLRITDLSMLKITKVKPWAVYFIYNDEKYLLHETDNDDIVVTLFKKKYIGNRYELEYEASSYGWIGTIPLKTGLTKKRNLVYNHIDLLSFVKRLESKKLLTIDIQKY